MPPHDRNAICALLDGAGRTDKGIEVCRTSREADGGGRSQEPAHGRVFGEPVRHALTDVLERNVGDNSAARVPAIPRSCPSGSGCAEGRPRDTAARGDERRAVQLGGVEPGKENPQFGHLAERLLACLLSIENPKQEVSLDG